MTLQVHTTGSALLSVQYSPFIGSPPAIAQLGYTEDGVRIAERGMQTEVHSDSFGGLQGAPIDIQQMGSTAEIRAKLIQYEHTVVTRLRQRAVGTALTEGQLANPGCLLVADDENVRVLIQGTKDTAAIGGGGTITEYMTPLNYMNCVVRDVIDIEVGSKVTTVEVVFLALPFIDAGDSNKLKLFNRVIV